MSDTWDDMRRAKEEQFFDEQNKAAIARLKEREGKKPRLSPITGEPMEQITIMGVVVDRCPKSGGIWLDAGELEQLVNAAKREESQSDWFSTFLKGLRGRK